MKKRDFGDWLFDNFGWVVGSAMLAAVICGASFVYTVATHAHDIAREAGSLAKSAADGYANSKTK